MRRALVTALLACSENTLKRKTEARRFLQGLSSDELQFIAEYLGSRILEAAGPEPAAPRRKVNARAAEFQNFHSCASVLDQEHKMILLVEYLRRSGSASVVRSKWGTDSV